MKKSFFLLTLLLTPLAASADLVTDITDSYADAGGPAPSREATASKFHGLLGGALFAESKVVGGKGRGGLFPLVFLNYADTAYWNVGGGGVWLLKSSDRKARAGFAFHLRGGYRAADDDALSGMEDRRPSLEAGVNASWLTPAGLVGAGWYADVTGRSGGSSGALRLSWPWRVNDRLRLTPGVSAEWVGRNVVDYYYGVRPSEAAASRPAYAGRAAVNARLALGAAWKLSDAWHLIGGLAHTRFGGGVSRSPLVERDGVTAVYAGAAWRF